MKKLFESYIQWYEEGLRIKEELINMFPKLKADESCEMITCMNINLMTDGVKFDYAECADGYYANYIDYEDYYNFISGSNEPYVSMDDKYLLFIYKKEWYVFDKQFEVEDVEDCA